MDTGQCADDAATVDGVAVVGVQMMVGESREAIATGRAGLDCALGIRSNRLDTEMRRVAHACHDDHPRIPDAVDLAADLLRR